jgi:hypothetical protein
VIADYRFWSFVACGTRVVEKYVSQPAKPDTLLFEPARVPKDFTKKMPQGDQRCALSGCAS